MPRFFNFRLRMNEERRIGAAAGAIRFSDDGAQTISSDAAQNTIDDKTTSHWQSSIGALFANDQLTTGDHWRACLSLRFAAQKNRTVLVERMHLGPLVVQKPLYPEGENICHAMIVHPPGGIAGGDRLQLIAQIDENAHALLTTPGAGKWYKSNGHFSQQQLQFTVANGAALEWLPQETIIFDAAQAQMRTRVELNGSAKYAGWEIICFGRKAAGEKFASGFLRQHTQYFRNGELIWHEATTFTAGECVMTSPVGLNGCSVCATFTIAAGVVPQSIVDACREIIPRAGNHYGITALPEIFVARCIGHNAEHVREYFEMLWKVLRPWYANTEMQRPRIWNT